MNHGILVAMLSVLLFAGPASARKHKHEDPHTRTIIYMMNKSRDIAPNSWGGQWNQDVFNACVDLLRSHADSAALHYRPQGVELVVADSSSNPQGWQAIFEFSGGGGFHTVSSSGYPIAKASTSVLLAERTPCTVMGEELAEMIGNPRPGSICFTTPRGNRIEPEITDPIWGSVYCPQGYEPECADAGPLPRFVLPAWFAGKYGVAGLSAEMTFPAGAVSEPWQKTTGGKYFPCY